MQEAVVPSGGPREASVTQCSRVMSEPEAELKCY